MVSNNSITLYVLYKANRSAHSLPPLTKYHILSYITNRNLKLFIHTKLYNILL